MKRIVVDLDGTLCQAEEGDYLNAKPNLALIDQLKTYESKGFQIIINTSRNMRTFNGNIGQINAFTLPIIIQWLDRHHVPYHEIIVGKPWCGFEGFYIDDKAIRPSEFLSMSYNELIELLEKEK